MGDLPWNAFNEAKADEVVHKEQLGEPTKTRELTESELYVRRLKKCLENWPDAERGEYNPRCCRFPKDCNPHARIEAVRAGNVTDADLEPRR